MRAWHPDDQRLRAPGGHGRITDVFGRAERIALALHHQHRATDASQLTDA